MGEIGDQYRRPVGAIPDRPIQPRLLPDHKFEEPVQPFVVESCWSYRFFGVLLRDYRLVRWRVVASDLGGFVNG